MRGRPQPLLDATSGRVGRQRDAAARTAILTLPMTHPVDTRDRASRDHPDGEQGDFGDLIVLAGARGLGLHRRPIGLRARVFSARIA